MSAFISWIRQVLLGLMALVFCLNNNTIYPYTIEWCHSHLYFSYPFSMTHTLLFFMYFLQNLIKT
jgi:hypothetical protein